MRTLCILSPNPRPVPDKSKGNAYNEKADKRSWEGMKSFFKEIFSGSVHIFTGALTSTDHAGFSAQGDEP